MLNKDVKSIMLLLIGFLIMLLMDYYGILIVPFLAKGIWLSLAWSFVSVIFLTLIHLVWFYILIPNNKFSIYWENITFQKVARFFYPSLAEEVWFRGIFLLLLFRIIGYWAIFAVAFLFALVHLKREARIFSFLMGILFGFIVVYTDNIVGPILGHLLFNVINYDFVGPVKNLSYCA